MREKEISEIKRRFKNDGNNINYVIGCYVDTSKQIVSQFRQSISLMQEEEKEKILTILRKTLSGTYGKNLIDLEFSTQQVAQSDEHTLLMDLRKSSLENETVVNELYQKIINSVEIEEPYLILLAFDKYDVPYKSQKGEKSDFDFSETFSYFVCSVCPVKMTKPALGYYVAENEFHNSHIDWLVATPILGFMFPAFDDRSSNIYSALHFTKDLTGKNEDFIRNIFNIEPEMPAVTQMQTFNSVLSESLGEECSLDTMQAIHSKVTQLVVAHKEAKEEDPLKFSKLHLKGLLAQCEVSDDSIEKFENEYDIQFGEKAELSPKNIVEIKKFKLETPNVTVSVNPDRTDLVDTQIIDGTKYLLIRLEEGVEVNGVNIDIK